MLIPVCSSKDLNTTPEKTEIRLTDGKLFIPEELYRRLGEHTKADAVTFLKTLNNFPTAFTQRLGWELNRMKAFTQQLDALLKGPTGTKAASRP